MITAAAWQVSCSFKSSIVFLQKNSYSFCEYIHVNFQFFQIDDVQPLTDDFSWLREFQGESLDSGAADLLESQMLGVQRGLEKVLGLFVIHWKN